MIAVVTLAIFRVLATLKQIVKTLHTLRDVGDDRVSLVITSR
ncbi:MAG TPA: hypothetical protein V6D18_13480 [Thermosynechococcaceae cyanobacterium]